MCACVHMCVCMLQTLCAIWTDISAHFLYIHTNATYALTITTVILTLGYVQIGTCKSCLSKANLVANRKLTDSDVVQLS